MTEITCSRCGERKTALDRAPLPGRYGPLLREHTCADCWRDWIEEQTRIINHEGLSPGQPEHRQVLYQRMATFLKLKLKVNGS